MYASSIQVVWYKFNIVNAHWMFLKSFSFLNPTFIRNKSKKTFWKLYLFFFFNSKTKSNSSLERISRVRMTIVFSIRIRRPYWRIFAYPFVQLHKINRILLKVYLCDAVKWKYRNIGYVIVEILYEWGPVLIQLYQLVFEI